MSGHLGLVLAGGAARGAYEAGVLRYVFRTLPVHLGWTPWPDVVSGTSVGALNGVYAVARSAEGIDWQAQMWRELSGDEVYDLSWGDLVHTLRGAFGQERFALADPGPLQRTVARRFPRRALARAIEEHGATFMVTATELRTGTRVVFVDSGRTDFALPPQPGVRVERTRIRAAHTLASAALPFLFPPLELDGVLYVDGGLRQNTPLQPVLAAGVSRALVISLKLGAQDRLRAPQPANLPFLAGKTLHALLLDPVEQDVARARERARLVAWGVETFGPEFATRAAEEVGLRSAEVLMISPSEDLGVLAARVFEAAPTRGSGALRMLLARAAAQSGQGEADLLSYVYFERAYTAELEALGYRDAERHQEELAALFGPGPP